MSSEQVLDLTYMGSLPGTKHPTHNGAKLLFPLCSTERLMKNLWGNICRLCCGKNPKPWRQSDFIINNSAFLLARSSILESPLEIEHQIDKLERFFSLVGQLACGVFITRGDCHLINHLQQCKSYTWDRAISNAHRALYPLLSGPGAISLWLKRQHESGGGFVRCLIFSRPPTPPPKSSTYPTKRLTFPVRPPGWSHVQPSCLPPWLSSRGECIWLPTATCSRSKEWGGSPASSWLTCWHAPDTVL